MTGQRISRAVRNRNLRVHAAVDFKPLCGGGFKARGASWQLSLDECNCKACQKILGGGGAD